MARAAVIRAVKVSPKPSRSRAPCFVLALSLLAVGGPSFAIGSRYEGFGRTPPKSPIKGPVHFSKELDDRIYASAVYAGYRGKRERFNMFERHAEEPHDSEWVHSVLHELRFGMEPGVAEMSSRYYFKDHNGDLISPWHDVPLMVSGPAGNEAEFWMITEIPKMTRAKMEISTSIPWNPITQDIKNGKLRDYHGPIYWNYGCLPQTWENPRTKHPELQAFGDNDPLDVVEIGSQVLETGSVTKVKVLGALAMIDSGEIDWKLIAINTADPLADKLNDIADVEVHLPSVVSGIREWFRWYKIPDGKPLNEFGFDGKAFGREYAIRVVKETHEAWETLHNQDSTMEVWTGHLFTSD